MKHVELNSCWCRFLLRKMVKFISWTGLTVCGQNFQKSTHFPWFEYIFDSLKEMHWIVAGIIFLFEKKFIFISLLSNIVRCSPVLIYFMKKNIFSIKSIRRKEVKDMCMCFCIKHIPPPNILHNDCKMHRKKRNLNFKLIEGRPKC